jgi:DNA-directed RNA polymerase specialized sigma24 family protein
MTMTSTVEAPLPLASPAIRRLLTRYVARRVPACDVDDVVQATLCDALASGRAPQQAPDLQRFLLSIARFKVVDALRLAGRAAPAEGGELPAPAPPVEALSLARWAERQLPSGPANEATLRWMVREAEGDKLEAIAADEDLPAERVRQRVSRLRRWMRERWVAELALVATLAVIAVAVLGATHRRYETILPEIAAGTPADARLRGTWKLASFTPAAPLPAARKALVDRLAPSLTVTFDGRNMLASAADGGWSRTYAASIAANGRIEAVESTAPGRPVSVTYAWEGDELVVTVPGGKWAGVARFRPAR